MDPYGYLYLDAEWYQQAEKVQDVEYLDPRMLKMVEDRSGGFRYPDLRPQMVKQPKKTVSTEEQLTCHGNNQPSLTISMFKTDRKPLDDSTQVEDRGKYTHYIYENKEALEAEAETLIKLGLNPQYYKEV